MDTGLKQKQHLLPEFYLEQWVDRATVGPKKTPMVWVIAKDGQRGELKAVGKSVFYRHYFYDLLSNTGKRDQSLENTLSKIESASAKVIKERIPNKEALDQDEADAIDLFVACMFMRTERKRKSVRDFVLTKSRIEKDYAQEYGKSIPDTSLDEDNAHPFAVFTAIEVISAEIMAMGHVVLVAPEGHFFVTSDDPCVWAANGPVGLRNPTITITLPLSPSHLLHISRTAASGYLDATDQDVDEMNRRTILGSEKYFISSLREIDPRWLK